MNERGERSFESSRLRSLEISMRIRGLFEDTLRNQPENFPTYVTALHDIIALRQQKYNVEKAAEKVEANRSLVAIQKLAEEREQLLSEEARVFTHLENDNVYNDVYEGIANASYELDVIFLQNKTKNPYGATIRELKRVKRYVDGLSS